MSVQSVSRPAKRPAQPKHLQFERLDSRELMAAVIWENNSPPPGFHAQVQGGALVFNGSPQRDKVLVHDIIANKSQKQLVEGKSYIEIQHQDNVGRLRRGWLEQPKDRANPLNFVFYGNAGDDHFQYFDSTADPAVRRDRTIVAYGGDGNDSLHGYNQNDILFGDEGKDDLFGELGKDLLVGGVGNDRLWGDGVTRANPTQSTDADYLEGGEGVDELYGWQGGDILNGGNYWKVNDGSIDKLYGYGEADCFYLETFSDPRKKESNDLSVVQGDRPDIFGTIEPPPSYDNWLGSSLVSQPAARPFNTAAFPSERAKFATNPAAFPNLGQQYEVLGPSSTAYNCIAASVGVYSRPVWNTTPTLTWADSVYMTDHKFTERVPYNSPRGQALLADRSKEIAVVYGFKEGPEANLIQHGSVRSADGTWISKMGNLALIRHPTPESVAGGQYGQPLYIYAKTRAACGCG